MNDGDAAHACLTRLTNALRRGMLASPADIDAELEGASLSSVWEAAATPGPLVGLLGPFVTHEAYLGLVLVVGRRVAERHPTLDGGLLRLEAVAAAGAALRERPARMALQDIVWPDLPTEEGQAACSCLKLAQHMVQDDRQREAWNATMRALQAAQRAGLDGKSLAALTRAMLAPPTVAQLLGPDPGWSRRGRQRRSGKAFG